MKKNWIINILFALNLFYCHSQDRPVETLIQKGHIQPVSVMEWHPSGNYFATGSEDQSIILWDAETGKQIRTFNFHNGEVIQLQFSKDGSELLSSGLDNQILVSEVRTGNLLERYTYDRKNEYPMSVSFSSKEDIILVGDNAGLFTIIQRNSEQRKRLTKGYSAPVSRTSVSPSGEWTVNIDSYKEFELIHLISGTRKKIPFDKPYQFSFSPDGKYLYVASSKLICQLFSIPEGELTQTFKPEKQCDGCKFKMAWSPDSKSVATFNRYTGLEVRKVKGGKLISSTSFNEVRAARIEFNNSGELIMVHHDDQVTIVRASDGKILHQFDHDFVKLARPKFHPGKPIILTANKYFSTASYNASTGKKIKEYKGFLNHPDAVVKKLDYGSWFQKNIVNHVKYLPALSISQDKQFLALGKTDTSLAVLNLKTGIHIPVLKGHTEKVTAVAFHPQKNILVSGDANGTLMLWDVEKRILLDELRGHTNVIFDLSFSSDGSQLLTASWDGTVKHYDVNNTLEQAGYIDMNDVSAYSVSFSPGDLYIVVGDVFQNLILYEADTRKEVKRYIGHSKTVSDFTFIDDRQGGLLIATAGRDGFIKIWDFYSGMLKDKFVIPFDASGLSIDFDTKRQLLYCGSGDRKVYVYDVKNKKLSHHFIAHQTGVCFVEVQGEQLYTKSIDGEVKVWKNIQSKQPSLFYSFYQMTSKDWLIREPEGHFDGTQKAMNQINFIQGMQSLKVGTFFKKYYHPNLFKQLNTGQRFQGNEQGIQQLLDNELPQFDLYFKNFQNQLIQSSSDTVYEHNSSNLQLELRVKNAVKDVDEVLVYNNGKIVYKEPFENELTFRSSGKQKQLEIPLYPKNNLIHFKLTTKEGLSTEQQTLEIFFDTLSGKTELFILSLGINKYDNNNYNLNYAKNDAESFSEAIENQAKTLFHRVVSVELSDKKVNKQNVYDAIQDLKQQIGPEDVFIFYFAGHGMMVDHLNGSSDFFLIMSDITNLYGDEEMLKEKGISAKDLLEISKNMVAQKQVFVLDACQSGAALKDLAVRGVQREKTLAQLARNTGTFFLTAAQDAELANEVGALGHGVFTYAILELLEGKTQHTETGETVSIYEMKSYVENRVPELSKEYKGSPQYPTGYSFGNDFPIGVIK